LRNQIWATGTALGRAVKGDYSAVDAFVEDPTEAAAVKAFTDALYTAEASTFFRALSAEAFTSTPWNRDDFGGFAIEQRLILDMLKANTNNPIVLAGDLHDGYAWTLYEDGEVDGTPTAVNLICPGVTSPVSWAESDFLFMGEATIFLTFHALLLYLINRDGVPSCTRLSRVSRKLCLPSMSTTSWRRLTKKRTLASSTITWR
jgi:hypothetical protein